MFPSKALLDMLHIALLSSIMQSRPFTGIGCLDINMAVYYGGWTSEEVVSNMLNTLTSRCCRQHIL